jgi:hypothetical protein
MAEEDTEAAIRWTQRTLQDHAARHAMTASLDLWMWPSDGQDSEGNPDGGPGTHETMSDPVARGDLHANGSAGGDDTHEIEILGDSRARSQSPYDEAVHTMQEADVQSSRPVRGAPALGGGVGVGAWASQDGDHGMAVDSVPDMAGAVHCTCTALGGSGGSGDGTAGGDAVGVRVAVAGGGDGGASRAADEGVHRVVPGQPEAETVAGGSYGGGVPGGADGAASPPVGGGGPALSAATVRDDAASRETMACDVSGGDLRQTGFQSWKARKTALKNQKRALARPPQHP